MEIPFLLKGLLIGFLASVPLGPIGVLCLQRTLSKKFRSGFLSGLGAATADTFFAIGALYFLSIILSFIDTHINIIKVIGGIMIVGLGVAIYSKNPVVQIRRNRANQTDLWKDYLSVFFLTLTNPAYILVFVALFAAFGISGFEMSTGMRAQMILGVFLGASAWWFVITFSLNLIRSRFRPRHLLWINRITGAIIVVLGTITILSIFVSMPPPPITVTGSGEAEVVIVE